MTSRRVAIAVGGIALATLASIAAWLRSDTETRFVDVEGSLVSRESSIDETEPTSTHANEAVRVAPAGAVPTTREESSRARPFKDIRVALAVEIEEIDGCVEIPAIEVVVEEPGGKRHAAITGPFEAGVDVNAPTPATARATFADVRVMGTSSPFRLFTNAPGWQLVPEILDLDAYDVDGPSPTIEVCAVLVHQRVFEGRVFAADTGEPIVAHVSYRQTVVPMSPDMASRQSHRARVDGDPRTESSSKETVTDAEGKYRIVLPFADASFAVRADRHFPELWTPAPMAAPSDDVEVHDFVLRPDPVTAQLHIAAVLHDGSPAAGGALSVIVERLDPFPIDLLEEQADVVGTLRGTKGSGSYVLHQLRDGAPLDPLDDTGEAHLHIKFPARLLVRVSSGDACAVSHVEITPRAVERVQLVLEPAAGLDMRVTKDGVESPQSTRYAIQVAGEPTHRDVYVEADGIIRLRGLDPGTAITFHPLGDSYPPTHFPNPATVFAPASAGSVLACVVDFVGVPSTVVRGVVVDAETGNGVSARVFALLGRADSFGRVQCESNGRFEIALIPGVTLHASEIGYASSKVSWNGGQGELPPIRLTRILESNWRDASAVVSGRVVAGHKRWSIPGAEVSLVPRGTGSSIWHDYTGDDGTFRIDRVPAGDFEIRVQHGSLSADRKIDVAAGRIHDLEMVLVPPDLKR